MDVIKQSNNIRREVLSLLSRLFDHEGRVIIAVGLAAFGAVLIFQDFEPTAVTLLGQVVVVISLLVIVERGFYLWALHRQIAAIDDGIVREREAFARELDRANTKLRRGSGTSGKGATDAAGTS